MDIFSAVRLHGIIIYEHSVEKTHAEKILNKPYPQNHIVILRATKPYRQTKAMFARA